ncbi:hypothetical protein SNE40_002768 [Patella caerulea]|uniref:Uncharacterized protein n=1 Tax=Patella caerulea TaxID=87958 RepID=A0AAN8K1P9_PATCE
MAGKENTKKCTKQQMDQLFETINSLHIMVKEMQGKVSILTTRLDVTNSSIRELLEITKKNSVSEENDKILKKLTDILSIITDTRKAVDIYEGKKINKYFNITKA